MSGGAIFGIIIGVVAGLIMFGGCGYAFGLKKGKSTELYTEESR